MLKVQFEKYFIGKNQSSDQVFDLDLKILKYSRKNGLMQEGIRSLIIDKKKADWEEESVYKVSDEKVKKILGIENLYKEK